MRTTVLYEIWYERVLLTHMHTHCTCVCAYFDLLIGSDRPTIALFNKFVRVGVVKKWKDLGVQLLGSSHFGQLDVIELDNPNSVEERCTKMFQYWLDVEPTATWNKLILALKEIGLNTLSEKITIDILRGTCMYTVC